MIKLILKNGKTITFSLKDIHSEIKLRNMWYCMSDTPKFSSQEIEAETDQGKIIKHKIGEILDCTYVEKPDTYTVKVPHKEPEMDVLSFLESRTTYMGTEVEESQIDLADMVDRYCEIASEVYKTIPACLRKKIALFYSEIKSKGIPFDISNPMLLKNFKDFLIDSESNIHKHVENYCSQKKNIN